MRSGVSYAGVYFGSEPTYSAIAFRSFSLKSLPKGGMTELGPRGRASASNLDAMNETGLVVMSVLTIGTYP